MTDVANLVVKAETKGVARTTAQLNKLSKEASKTGKSLMGLKGSLSQTALTFAKFAGIASISAIFGGAVKSAVSFQTAMTEVATLTNSMDMSALTESVKEMSEEFGADKITTAKALYQVISAGASTAAEATEILAAANKLAVGGVTDVATAADGLTSAMNAYGVSANGAVGLSDAMFVAMKAGKTTIGELSQNIGKLAPIAAQAGVSFDELMAATAAVTKTGLSTSMTMNSLRQVMAGILKPTKEAADEAERLGITFTGAHLKSVGFTKVLDEIKTATGGSTESLTKLFGSVEALGSIMSLTSGTTGQAYLQILEDMKVKSGATEEAFNKMKDTVGFLWGVLKEKLNTVLLETGETLLKVVKPALEITIDHFDKLIGVVGTLGLILSAGVLSKGLLALPALLKGAGKAMLGVVAIIGKLTLALMTNPFGLIAVAISASAVALYKFRDSMVTIKGVTGSVGKYVAATWDYIGEKTLGLRGFFKLAFGGLKDYAGDAFDSIVTKTKVNLNVIGKLLKVGVNSNIRFFHALWESWLMIAEGMVNAWKGAWKTIVKLSKTGWQGIKNLFKGKLDFSEFGKALTESFADPLKEFAVEYADTMVEIFNTDYIGEWGNAIGDVLSDVGEDIAGMVEKVNRAEDYAGLQPIVVTVKRIGDEGEKTGAKLTKSFDDAKKSVDPFADALVHAVKRTDSAFVNAWRNIGSGFNSLKDSILDSFSQMLAEMAHMAITRPIMIGIMGGGTVTAANATGTAANAVSGATGVMGALKGGFAGLSASIAGGFTTVGTTLTTSLSRIGLGNAAVGLQAQGAAIAPGFQGVNQVTVGAAAGMLAGYVGAELGKMTFNNEGSTGIGAGVGGVAGGIVGSIYGGNTAIGAGIGAFLGEGLEKVLGDIFGFGGKAGNNLGGESFNFGTGSREEYGIGNFDYENVERSRAFLDVFEPFAELMGGVELSGKVEASDRGFIRYDGEKYGGGKGGNSEEKLYQKFFNDMIEGADNMTESMKGMLSGLQGGASEMLTMSGVLLTAFEATNSVTDSVANLVTSFQGTTEEVGAFASAIAGSIKPDAIIADATSDLILAFHGTADEINLFTSAVLSGMDETGNLNKSLYKLLTTFEGTATQVSALAGIVVSALGEDGEISQAVSDLLINFSGTTERLIEFATGLLMLQEATSENPAKSALADYFTLVEYGSKTITDVYGEQKNAVGALISSYDGSVDSTTALAQQYGIMQQQAYGLTIALLDVGAAIKTITEDSAESIRTSIMTGEQLFNYRKEQRDSLEDALKTMVDPSEIEDTVKKIISLSEAMFNALPDYAQVKEVQDYAGYAEYIGELGTERISETVAAIQDEQEAFNIATGSVMEFAAATMTAATDNFSLHVNSFSDAVKDLDAVVAALRDNGINVSVEVDVNESADVAVEVDS